MWIPSDLLPQVFQELHQTSKVVQLAAEELHQQNQELIQTCNWLEAECQRYQGLFELALDAYLVTNAEGIIQEMNWAAAKLFKVSKRYLVRYANY